MHKKKRPSLRTLGRKALPKGWHENCEKSCHAPAEYRRHRMRSAIRKEKQDMANYFANNGSFENFEPLHIAKRDADWFWF